MMPRWGGRCLVCEGGCKGAGARKRVLVWVRPGCVGMPFLVGLCQPSRSLWENLAAATRWARSRVGAFREDGSLGNW